MKWARIDDASTSFGIESTPPPTRARTRTPTLSHRQTRKELSSQRAGLYFLFFFLLLFFPFLLMMGFTRTRARLARFLPTAGKLTNFDDDNGSVGGDRRKRGEFVILFQFVKHR